MTGILFILIMVILVIVELIRGELVWDSINCELTMEDTCEKQLQKIHYRGEKYVDEKNS